MILHFWWSGCNGPRPNDIKIADYQDAKRVLVKGVMEKTLTELDKTGKDYVPNAELGELSAKQLKKIHDYAQNLAQKIINAPGNARLSSVEKETLRHVASVLSCGVELAKDSYGRNTTGIYNEDWEESPNVLDVASGEVHDNQPISVRKGSDGWVNRADLEYLKTNSESLENCFRKIYKDVLKSHGLQEA